MQGGYICTGNIAVDPLFIDLSNGDYHLQPAHPYIDVSANNEDVPDVEIPLLTKTGLPYLKTGMKKVRHDVTWKKNRDRFKSVPILNAILNVDYSLYRPAPPTLLIIKKMTNLDSP